MATQENSETTGRQIDRQTDRQTDRANGKIDRQRGFNRTLSLQVSRKS